MFKELAPFLRQRAVLLTVTRLEEDQIRVNVIPKQLKEGENEALTTPLSVTGTAEELDRDLPSTLVKFVSSHLQLKTSLEKAQAEMDAAAKTAQAEARAKAKTPARKDPPKQEFTTKPAANAKTVEIARPEPARTAGLFDAPESPSATPVSSRDMEEEDDILAEVEEEGQEQDEEVDEAA